MNKYLKCNDDFNDIQKYIYSTEDTEEQYDLVMLCFRVRRVQRRSTHEMARPTTRIVLIWAMVIRTTAVHQAGL